MQIMAVTFVETGSETILSEILSDFETITGRTLLPSQPEYLFCSSLAYRIILERERQNTTGNSQLLEFSTSPILDYIVALVGITRLTPQYAVCTLQFTLIEGHGGVVIPAGTRVISTDGQVVFATKYDTTVLSGVLVVNIDAECQTSGIAANGYDIDTITDIQDVQAYLTACRNIDITAGGTDSETDEQLRARAFAAPAQFSVAGSRNAYKFFTLSVSPLIIDVGIVTYEDDNTIALGEIDVYPLLANGEVATQPLIDEIQETLSSDTIRPLSDTVVVKNPTKVEYDVVVNITKYTTATNATILALVNPLLLAFGASKLTTLGQDIINSEIEALCRVAGVYDLEVIITPAVKSLTGDNLIIENNEFPYLNNFTVNLTSTNNG